MADFRLDFEEIRKIKIFEKITSGMFRIENELEKF